MWVHLLIVDSETTILPNRNEASVFCMVIKLRNPIVAEILGGFTVNGNNANIRGGIPQ